MNIFLFLAGVFIFTFLVGKFLERFRVPWIFASLLLGIVLSAYNPFINITSSSTFEFLAELGMYFLLFIIGFELDLTELKKQEKFIFKSTFFIIFFEAFFGTLLIHFVFSYSLLLSFIVSLSFATVGEAILIPILDEFKLVNKKLGQSIIGIGTLDDLIEVLVLIFLALFIEAKTSVLGSNIPFVLSSLFLLFFLAFGLTKLKKERARFNFLKIETLFLFIIFIFFLFLGIGKYAHATAIAALISGIALKTFIPNKRLNFLENEVKTMCYGLFAPIFFLWVGLSTNFSYIFSHPLLVLLIIFVSSSAKILGSFIVGKKELGEKESILLGIGLCVRFSTSMVIVKILLDNGFIDQGLYSIIIASSMLFVLVIPILFSKLLFKFGIIKKNDS